MTGTPPPAHDPPRRLGRGWRIALGALVLLVVVAAGGAAAALVAWRHFARGLPDIPALAEYRPPVVTQLVSGDGQLAGEIFEERRKVVPMERIP